MKSLQNGISDPLADNVGPSGLQSIRKYLTMKVIAPKGAESAQEFIEFLFSKTWVSEITNPKYVQGGGAPQMITATFNFLKLSIT